MLIIILLVISILGLILIFTSLIGILGGYCRNRRMIHVLYLIFVIIAFIYQISVAVIIFDEANHISNWLSDTWNNSPIEYKLYAQKKFSCCGFNHPLDHFIVSSMCIPNQKVVDSSIQSCHRLLSQFVQSKLSWMYIALFVGLSIELLALTNSITYFCTYYPITNSVSVANSKEDEASYPVYTAKDDMLPPNNIVRQF